VLRLIFVVESHCFGVNLNVYELDFGLVFFL